MYSLHLLKKCYAAYVEKKLSKQKTKTFEIDVTFRIVGYEEHRSNICSNDQVQHLPNSVNKIIQHTNKKIQISENRANYCDQKYLLI